MKLFHSARPAQLELVPAREVRVFQSETAEILEGPEPLKAHLTVVILAGMFASLLLVVACMRVDRVISSLSGEIVTVEPTVVLGALDQSIIKTIDVSEGQKVMKGDLLATLDPTFTRADVGALKSQVANLNAQIARCQAELAQKPFDMPLQTDPTVIYGMGDSYAGHLHKHDLLTDTPYNTYTRMGLPPTPISLPGVASLQAALNPRGVALVRGARHPYSALLMQCVPDLRAARTDRMPFIPGQAPGAAEPEQGCAFAPRCPRSTERCSFERPRLVDLDAVSQVACHYPLS